MKFMFQLRWNLCGKLLDFLPHPKVGKNYLFAMSKESKMYLFVISSARNYPLHYILRDVGFGLETAMRHDKEYITKRYILPPLDTTKR